MKELQIALAALQANTIGLFVNNHKLSDKQFELVIGEQDSILHMILIGNLGGIAEAKIPMNRGIFKRFPDNQTLADMKKNPYALKEFIDNFFK